MGVFEALLGLGIGYLCIKCGFKVAGAVVSGTAACIKLGWEGTRQLTL
jgi:hypothetical protein